MKTGFTIATEAPAAYPALIKGYPIENIKKAAAYGAQSIELHLPDPTSVDVEGLLKTCEETGVTVSAIGTGLATVLRGISLTSDDEEVCQRAISTLYEYIDMAAKLNSVVIMGSIRGRASDPGGYGAYAEKLAKNLRIAADYAAEKQVILVMEIINRYELLFLNNAKQVAGFLKELDRPNVKMHLDTFHMNIEETSMSASILPYKGLIGHVHAADNTRSYPGSGTIDFKEIAVALQAVGYDGAFSMECMATPDEKTSITEGLKVLNGAVNYAKQVC